MANRVWGDSDTRYFYELDPNQVLNCIDILGLETTGRVLTLNSMENRVYEIEIYDNNNASATSFVVAKFYRPGRWSKEQILDEHNFLCELFDEELNVIAPISIGGKTLFYNEELRIFYCLFPKKGGRIPDEMNEQKLEELGRLIARVHNIGARSKASHRLTINPTSFGLDNLEIIRESKHLPENFRQPIIDIIKRNCDSMYKHFENITNHRIHGDAHRSNIIYRENEGAYLVDFDDMLNGPAVQDIWLMVPGSDDYAKKNRSILLENYEQFRDFDYRTLNLIEPLRALRFIHFSAWMSKRYDDPAFVAAFPYFGSDKYWSELLNDLRVQLDLIKDLGNDNMHNCW